MAIFFIVYGLAGLALHKASREASEGGKFLYFLVFPFHAALVPLIAALGSGTKDLLNNKGFWALLAVGLTAYFATDSTLRADPFDAFVMALISVGVLKGFHYCFKECFGI